VVSVPAGSDTRVHGRANSLSAAPTPTEV
jgi:hypothetical protein